MVWEVFSNLNNSTICLTKWAVAGVVPVCTAALTASLLLPPTNYVLSNLCISDSSLLPEMGYSADTCSCTWPGPELPSSQGQFTADPKNLPQRKMIKLGLIESMLSQSEEMLLNQSWHLAGSCCAVPSLHYPYVIGWGQFDPKMRVSAVWLLLWRMRTSRYCHPFREREY